MIKISKKHILFAILFLMFSSKSVFAYQKVTTEEYQEFLKKFIEEKYYINRDDESDESDTCSVGKVYAECKGITVSATGKTYDLETYVAGVLNAEPGYTIDNNEELGKAMAITIRSYTLAHTNNCTKSIGSSSFEQNLIDSSGQVNLDKYRKYADDTAGIVITDDKGIVEAVYYSLAAGECDSITNGMCKVTLYYRYESGGTHVVEVPVSALPSGTLGAHNSGIALFAAKYQSETYGWDYKKILTEYYGNIQLSKLTSETGTNIDNEASSSTSCNEDTGDMTTAEGVSFPSKNYDNIHQSMSISELQNNKYFANAGTNIGQCPWYAKARATEIINTSTLSDDLKKKATAVLNQTFGNGIDWYGGVNSSLGSYFAYSSDINKPMAGSIIAWSGGNGHNYGHVGIIEKVNSDGTVIMSDGWNGGGPNADDTWDNVKVETVTMTIDELRHLSGPYNFEGYTYLFSYRK